MVALSGSTTFYFLKSNDMSGNGGWTVTDKYFFNSYLRDGLLVGDPAISYPFTAIPAIDTKRSMCVVMVYDIKTD